MKNYLKIFTLSTLKLTIISLYFQSPNRGPSPIVVQPEAILITGVGQGTTRATVSARSTVQNTARGTAQGTVRRQNNGSGQGIKGSQGSVHGTDNQIQEETKPARIARFESQLLFVFFFRF